MGWIPVKLSRHLTLQNLRLMIFLVIFAMFGGPRKTDDLPTSPNNQFRDYFIRNHIAKIVPLKWSFAPQTSKTYGKSTKLFSILDLLPKYGFPKTLDLSPVPPRGVYISRNDPPPKEKSGKLQIHQQITFF